MEKSGDGETGKLGSWFMCRVLSEAGEVKVSGRFCCTSCYAKRWWYQSSWRLRGLRTVIQIADRVADWFGMLLIEFQICPRYWQDNGSFLMMESGNLSLSSWWSVTQNFKTKVQGKWHQKLHRRMGKSTFAIPKLADHWNIMLTWCWEAKTVGQNLRRGCKGRSVDNCQDRPWNCICDHQTWLHWLRVVAD